VPKEGDWTNQPQLQKTNNNEKKGKWAEKSRTRDPRDKLGTEGKRSLVGRGTEKTD